MELEGPAQEASVARRAPLRSEPAEPVGRCVGAPRAAGAPLPAALFARVFPRLDGATSWRARLPFQGRTGDER